MPPYIAWTAEHAGSPDALHWAVVAWWWETAVLLGGDQGAFLLLQGPDPVAAGRLMAWWKRPGNLLYACSGAGMTPAEALAQAEAGRQDPCPVDPYMAEEITRALTQWEPLWIPINNTIRMAQTQLLRRRHEDLQAREARLQAVREQRERRQAAGETRPRKRRRSEAAQPGGPEEGGSGQEAGDTASGGEAEGAAAAPEASARTRAAAWQPRVGRRYTKARAQAAEALILEELEAADMAAAAEASQAGGAGGLQFLPHEAGLLGESEDEDEDLAGPAIADIASQERDVAGEYDLAAGDLAAGILSGAPYPPQPPPEAAAGSERAYARKVDWERVRAAALSQTPPAAAARDLRYHSEEEEEEDDAIEEIPIPTDAPQTPKRRPRPAPQQAGGGASSSPAAATLPQRRQPPPPGTKPPFERQRPAATPEKPETPQAGPPTRELPPAKKAKTTPPKEPKPAGRPPVEHTLEHAFARSGRGPAPAAPGKPAAPGAGGGDPSRGAPGAAPAAEAKPAAPPASPGKPPAPTPKPAAETPGGSGRTTLSGAVAARLAGLPPPSTDSRTQRGRPPAGDKEGDAPQ